MRRKHQAGRMLTLIPLLLLLLIIAVLVVPTSMGAKLVGAVQTSYPMAVAAVIAGLILSAIFTIPVSLAIALVTKAPPPEALLVLIGVAASAFAYAKILETTFFGGITIYLIQFACAALVAGIAYAGVLGFAPDLMKSGGITDAADIRTSALRTAADSVCACGTDQDCLSREYRKLRKIAVDYEGALLLPAEKAKVDEYSRRAKLCAMQPVAPAAETEAAAPAPASP